ncbi:antitoxin Xre/MbcA/ParS toxin-binding domain-containing protein [Maribacter sp. R86514]|uniref:antitoxin Xre/MbcA/ParS toxin-binding domain-containing protein n=1 Tax=unclassified Maribacter TaxID=2615042 RepID=UPI0037CC008C
MENLKKEQIRLKEYGESVFEDKTNFEKWLKTKSKALGGITPESLLKSSRGVQKVMYALGRIEHGILA